MARPKSAKQHREKFSQNTQRHKLRGKINLTCACPFCAAPDFAQFQIEKAKQEAKETHGGCEDCRRGCAMIWTVSQGIVSAEIMRVTGDEPPNWFTDKQRKFTI